MKKLVAYALVGFGLTQVLVGCGDDDDDVTPGTSGSSTTGGKAGGSSGGTGSGGKAGAATGGTAGKGNGGNATSGSAGKGGSDVGGTTSNGGAGGDGGAVGDGGTAGDSLGGAGGAGGAGGDPVVPQEATEFWLNHFCEAQSIESLMCESSPEWSRCYSDYRPFLPNIAEGLCTGEDVEGVEPVKTLALMDALVALAAACPDPDVDQWRCTVAGAPQAKDQACRDADEARAAAFMACAL